MTTAHRPTWKAAVGRAQEGGWSAGGAISTQSSSRDLNSHTKLKFRVGAQKVGGHTDDRAAALQESLRRMEEAERTAAIGVKRAVRMGREQLLLEKEEQNEKEGRMKLLKQTADVDEEKIRAKYNDDDDDDDEGGGGGRWSDIEDGNLHSDESDLDASDDSDESDDDDDSDDEDEEAALQAELAKIRQERAAAKAKEEAEAAAAEQAQMEEAALTGNPLLNSTTSSGRVKRRWNDDVVFRNQAKTEPDQNKKRFINDTVRNDFHKRFLNKFIK